MIAGVSALLSALVYAEFAVDIPFAGSSYTYISAALGEFLAWITGAATVGVPSGHKLVPKGLQPAGKASIGTGRGCN